MAGEASSWYSTAEVDKTKWGLISTAFTKYYKPNGSLKYIWLGEFWSIKHSGGQSVEEFIQKVLSVGAKFKQPNNDLMLAITEGLAPSVKGYVLMKDPKTLDELIECARTAQHVQPQQSNNADVAKMVSAIISEQLSDFKTSINAIQFNNSRHWWSQSSRQGRFQSPGRDSGTQRGSGQTSQQPSCGCCGKSHSKFQCPAFNKTCNFCKKTGHFQSMCYRAKRGSSYAAGSNNQ